MILTFLRSAVLAASLMFAVSAFANPPGGGTNGANVTLTDNGTTVTLANGIISIVVIKASAEIHILNYTFNNNGSTQTINMLGGGYSGGKFYWETAGWGGNPLTYSVVANTTNYAEVEFKSDSASNGVWDVHFSLLKGATGFYVAPIWIHRSQDTNLTSMGECRDNIYSGSIFNWLSVDATRNKLMPFGASAMAVNSGPKEVSLWTNGIYAGLYEDKYKYTADYSTLRAWGWSSVGTGGKNVGLWDVAGSSEYMASGPMRRELVCHDGTTILNTPHGSHYGFCTDSTFATNEVWAKVCGPHFIYCNAITNTITATNTAAQALYADALAQADAEKGAWPYYWFTNSNYTPPSGRGAVSGKIVIADTYNPNASASNLWVGVELQPNPSSTVTYDFQKWYKPYYFWVKTDANGNFTIPNVIATNGYTLYAFGPGAAGTFQSQNQTGGSAPIELDIPSSPFSVTVTAGATNNLGTVTWTPTRVGPTVFEIGYPDRTGGKFRHGEDWWVGDIGPSASAPSPVWSKFLEYPFDFPNGPNYTVGQSRWTTDWNFIQPIVINSTGAYDPWGNNSGTTSTINFNLPSAPAGNASLYVGLSSDYMAAIIITVNGNLITSSTGYIAAYGNDQSDASIRESNHGLFMDNRLSVSSSYLHSGQNTITISIRQVGGNYLANHAMYDYLRLELPGYIPPAPATAKAYAGNNCNLICWPVQPGATSYNILRSTTSGSGYVSITNGVTGPVCGSGYNNAAFLDTTAGNSTNYYYVVRSGNTAGSSTNSPQANATPDAGISTSAPVAPTGLSIGGVAHQSVTLNWSGITNANFYTVYRSTLFNNGGGASNVLGTIVLANNVTNATYTDTSPTDGSIYSYVIAASSAGGTSINSDPAVAVPKPSPPATPPPSLFITSVISTNITATSTNLQQDVSFTWNAVPGAVGYAIYRATSASGPFTFIQSVSTTTFFDGGRATNQIYYYRVAALNAAGVSSYATDSINPKQAAPPSLTATATNAQIKLTWSAPPGATNYTVKRGTSVANETTTVVSGYAGTTYTNTGLANGTTYYFVVTATGAGGTSGNSPEASATPLVTGNGIWISPASGNWGAATNWTGSSIAAGAGNTADFSTLSLSADLAVTLDSARTIGSLIFGDTTANYNWTLAGTNTLTLGTSPSIEVVNQSVTISTPLAGTNGLSKTGSGALTLGGATNTITGDLAINSGNFTLDFSATNSPATNLVSSTNALFLGGSTIRIIGNTAAASSQTFNGVELDEGNSIISAAPASGANKPILTLGAIPENVGGTVEFIGPATTNSTGSVTATATITTTTAPGTAGVLGSLGLGKNGAFATVGLYDWATTNTATSPYTIAGGSQVAGFYQTAGVTSGGNYDVNSGGVNTIGNAGGASTLRYNQNAALTVNNSTFTFQNCQGILVTPKCGANNETISGSSLDFYRNSSGGWSYGVIWQNNPLGYLNCSIALNDGRQAGQNNGLVQAGPGTVVYSGANFYTLGTYLNGGFSVITAYGGFGQTNNGFNSVSPVTLNGGTVVGNATFTNSQAGANARPFVLGNNGGGLAATAGKIMTVDGVVSDTTGNSTLTIGIPAAAANNNTPGLLPGSGSGTANTTPVYASGTVALTAPNTFSGGTVLQTGTLNINGIYALGGANYGGLTFNGGTLQYVTNFPGNNGSADLTSIGTAGITLAAGGGTIDVNGNSVTYANSIGNSGSGALTVKSSLTGGKLTLLANNNYSGNTTITNATLLADNPTGSATGSGSVLVQNAGGLSGNGAVAGSVTVASGGMLAPGDPFDALNIGNNLVLAAGSKTLVQVQHSPFTNDAVIISGSLTEGGTLIVTNSGGTALAAGDTFQLFSAADISGSFSNFTLPSLATNLVWNTNLLNIDGTLSVAAYAPPVIGQLTATGTNLNVTGSGGIPGWNYYVLTATNLTAPVWIPVATNQFDVDGNFTFTNAMPPGLQRFYRLQLP